MHRRLIEAACGMRRWVFSRRVAQETLRFLSATVDKGGLKVDQRLVTLVKDEIAPGTGIDPEHFWSTFGKIVLENAKRLFSAFQVCVCVCWSVFHYIMTSIHTHFSASCHC